jgi:hypothetical protein
MKVTLLLVLILALVVSIVQTKEVVSGELKNGECVELTVLLPEGLKGSCRFRNMAFFLWSYLELKLSNNVALGPGMAVEHAQTIKYNISNPVPSYNMIYKPVKLCNKGGTARYLCFVNTNEQVTLSDQEPYKRLAPLKKKSNTRLNANRNKCLLCYKHCKGMDCQEFCERNFCPQQQSDYTSFQVPVTTGISQPLRTNVINPYSIYLQQRPQSCESSCASLGTACWYQCQKNNRQNVSWRAIVK